MPDRHRQHAPKRHRPAGHEDRQTLIFGIHAVEAALANPQRTVRRLYLTDNAEIRLQAALAARQLTHERALPRDLDRRLGRRHRAPGRAARDRAAAGARHSPSWPTAPPAGRSWCSTR